MTLLLDVGNSAIKWGWLRDGRVIDAGHQVHRDVDDLSALLMARWRKAGSVQVVGCTVAAAPLTATVEAVARACGAREVRWLASAARHDGPPAVINGYLKPTQLGADRWHAIVGGVALCPGSPLLIVSAGTATTVDCVTVGETGTARFIGGVIAPGVRLMRESLASGAAGLPFAEGRPMAFPDHTASAIVSGVNDAQVGLVGRVYRRFAREQRVEPTVLVAGGHADALAAELRSELRTGETQVPLMIEHNLVLRGLAERIERDR